MHADFKFEEECRGVCGRDFPPAYPANAPLCVPVTVSSSISSSAVTAGCLANISASVMLSLLFCFFNPLLIGFCLLRHAINWHVSGTMHML